MTNILVLYYSEQGATQMLAQSIAHGVESIASSTAVVRTVPKITSTANQTGTQASKTIPDKGPPFVCDADLIDCDGIIIGSPAYFGNMAAPLKYFFDQSSNLWLSGKMIGKPAAVFTSASTAHGGQESTLLSMILPLIHHGMLIVGIPYSEKALHQTQSGGTPYGASHTQANMDDIDITEHEKSLCLALGKRVATIATQLKA